MAVYTLYAKRQSTLLNTQLTLLTMIQCTATVCCPRKLPFRSPALRDI